MSLEPRLTELEIKLSYAEDMIETLNKALFRQQEQMELLQAQLTLLHRKIRENTQDDQLRDLREEIPPHY